VNRNHIHSEKQLQIALVSTLCRMSPAARVNVAHVTPICRTKRTIDRITTQGKLRLATIANANEVLPEPELPATPIILASPHGGL